MTSSQKIYRIYCFDAARHVVSVDEIKASSDEQAIAMTEEAGFGTKCELWDGRRMVAQLQDERREA